MKILFTGASSFTGLLVRPRAGGCGTRGHGLFRKPIAASTPMIPRAGDVALVSRALPSRSRLLVRRRLFPHVDQRRGLGPPLPPRRRRH